MKPLRPKTPTNGIRGGLRNGTPLVAARLNQRAAVVQPKEPVEVYCRLRPLPRNAEVSCVRQVNETTVCIVPPPNSQFFAKGIAKESTYAFKRVFGEEVSQEEIFNCVALPLVKDLLNGKSGLLFTYGITSSGKTFTMTGTPSDCGILPRTLDVIFSSIAQLQVRKYVFKPDGANGFEIVGIPDALLQEQAEKLNPKTPHSKKKDDSEDWSHRAIEMTKIDSLEADYGYAIFVSFIEIYNNYIYDLLEDLSGESGKVKSSTLSSKILREDKRQFMYVNGGTEVEVKTAEDAFDVLCKGIKRRRIAHTALNAESSRSHSVFTIRVVKAPMEPGGIEVLPNPEYVVVSQLSLVDLAGSERTSRTKGDQDRIREAGNINNSLLTLRSCIEILRENQKQGTSKVVPYRESKLTLLFKNFFDGEGRVRMIICVNPTPDDHDETVHVMKFGELTQEVCVNRPTGMPLPSSRYLLMRRQNDELEQMMVYDLRPSIPSLTLSNPQDDTTIPMLIQILKERQKQREILRADLFSKKNELRSRVSEMEIEHGSRQQRISALETDLQQRQNQIQAMESKLVQMEGERMELVQSLRERDSHIQHLKEELEEKCHRLQEADNCRSILKTQLQQRLISEREHMKRIMETRLAQKQAELELKMCLNDEKFRMLREILNSDDGELAQDPNGNLPAGLRNTEVKQRYNLRSSGASATERSEQPPPVPVKRKHGLPTANPRHSRAHSEGGQVWIEHRPPSSVDTGTVFQPVIKKRKSVSKLEVEHVTGSDASMYVLMHQNQDSDGDLETELYKGNIIPSAGGGAQVIFNDVETLQQSQPQRKC